MKLTFGMIDLVKDKKYYVIINNIKYTFKIYKGLLGWFVYFTNYYNDILFERYNIDKKKLTKKTLGYYIGDRWPWCETQDDCEKLLYALIDEISKKEECICDFHLLNKNDYWDD